MHFNFKQGELIVASREARRVASDAIFAKVCVATATARPLHRPTTVYV